MDFRGNGPRSKSDRPFLGHCAFLRRFRTEPRNRVWGVTVRLLWARNFEITHNWTTQLLDVDFRGLGPRSKSDRPFLGYCAFLRRFGTEPRNRVWGVTIRLLWARNLEITQNRTTQVLDVDFRDLGPLSKSDRPFLGHCAFFGVLGRNQDIESGASPFVFLGKKL